MLCPSPDVFPCVMRPQGPQTSIDLHRSDPPATMSTNTLAPPAKLAPMHGFSRKGSCQACRHTPIDPYTASGLTVQGLLKGFGTFAPRCPAGDRTLPHKGQNRRTTTGQAISHAAFATCCRGVIVMTAGRQCKWRCCQCKRGAHPQLHLHAHGGMHRPCPTRRFCPPPRPSNSGGPP